MIGTEVGTRGNDEKHQGGGRHLEIIRVCLGHHKYPVVRYWPVCSSNLPGFLALEHEDPSSREICHSSATAVCAFASARLLHSIIAPNCPGYTSPKGQPEPITAIFGLAPESGTPPRPMNHSPPDSTECQLQHHASRTLTAQPSPS